MPSPFRIADIKPVITNLAQTSHYQVVFGGLPSKLLGYLYERGIDQRFVGETVGLLCESAQIPGSALATFDVGGNYTGVSEKFAHTRLFTQIELDFYVDSNYRTIKFLEHWIEFIANGSRRNPTEAGYFFRMQYPENYKTDQTKMIKFDRDYQTQIEYTFYGLFPISMNAVPVSYNYSDLLRVSATFNFDRYVSGKSTSFAYFTGTDNNKLQDLMKTNINRNNTTGQRSIFDSNADFTNPLGVINGGTVNDLGSPLAGAQTLSNTSSSYDSSFRTA